MMHTLACDACMYYVTDQSEDYTLAGIIVLEIGAVERHLCVLH